MEKSIDEQQCSPQQPAASAHGECQQEFNILLSSSSPLSPNRGYHSNATQMFASFDTPLRKGGHQNSLCSSSTCVLMKDQTYHVAGMDIMTYQRNGGNSSDARRERYDPCCMSYSPLMKKSQLATSTRSFDHDFLASNRRRAQSDFLKKSKSCTAAAAVASKQNVRRQSRKYSTGPLIGTTVLVGCSSNDSFDCGCSSSDETISSIETPGEFNDNRPRTPVGRNTVAMNSVQDHETSCCALDQKVPTLSSSSYWMTLPNFFLGSRRRRSKIIKLSRATNSSATTNIGKDATKSQRKVMKFILLLLMGITFFSSNNDNNNYNSKHNHTRDNPIRSKSTESGTTGEIRTVKNFSGAWGLTLSDPEEEHGDELTNGNLRRKRRPKLSQANSLYTQQLSYPIQSTTFVLTDDEIKLKTKQLDEHNPRVQHQSKVFHFAWIFLVLVGLGMAWFEMGKKCRRARLMARPVGSLNNRYSR
jgi:hypothetical protein